MRRDRSPLRRRSSAELRLGLEILSAVSSAAAAAAARTSPKLAAAAMAAAPPPTATLRKPRSKRAAAAKKLAHAGSSSSPSRGSSSAAFCTQLGAAPVSPFADAGMQLACAGPGGRGHDSGADTQAAQPTSRLAAEHVPKQAVEHARGAGAEERALQLPGQAAERAPAGPEVAGGAAAKQAGFKRLAAAAAPSIDAHALLEGLGAVDAQTSFACECNMAVRAVPAAVGHLHWMLAVCCATLQCSAPGSDPLLRCLWLGCYVDYDVCGRVRCWEVGFVTYYRMRLW